MVNSVPCLHTFIFFCQIGIRRHVTQQDNKTWSGDLITHKNPDSILFRFKIQNPGDSFGFKIHG